MRTSRIMSLIFLVILICAYSVSLQFADYSRLSTIITTVTAIIGAYAIWIQLRKDSAVKQAEFIMNLNHDFITNPDAVRIERLLEAYRRDGINRITEDDRQSLVDYLVYHEGLAAMYFRGVFSLEVIDDLFSYRFFLAMNNPYVQQSELCPEAEYYRGCIKLYDVWAKYKRKRGRIMPLEETALDKSFDKYESLVTTK